MLLESQQWWSNAGLLRWEAKPLCSKRVMEFTDTMQNSPSPLNESALILNQWDIQSSRCLFRLVLSVRHIEGIESSSLPIMLQTPQTREVCETPEQMQQRKERNGYVNGTKYNGLMSQLMYDQRFQGLLKTPCAMDSDADKRADKRASKGVSGTSGTLAQEIASGYVAKRGLILPTPPAIEGEKYTNTYNPQSQMGKSLSAMAGSGMLPTPRSNQVTDTDLRNPKMAQRNKSNLEEVAKCLQDCSLEKDGLPFRLSPLFTEEMMGFPLMWTAWPFLLQNGELNH